MRALFGRRLSDKIRWWHFLRLELNCCSRGRFGGEECYNQEWLERGILLQVWLPGMEKLERDG